MFQQVTVIGNLGKDPEEFGDRDPIARFSVAATERWKDKDGEKQERTEWFNCSAFGKTAEIALKYLEKGNLVTVVGKMQTTKKDDKYYTNLIVDRLVLMPNDRGDSKPDRSERSERRPSRDRDDRPAREERRPAREERSERRTRDEPKSKQDDAFDDDIPF